jgi:hypothetical protein
MTSRPVALVAFSEQDNLGVGYIASVLMQEGVPVRILDFRLGPEAILDTCSGWTRSSSGSRSSSSTTSRASAR